MKKSVILLAVSSIVLTGIAEILASPLAGVFVSYDKNLLDMTTVAIRIYVISYIFAGFNIFASAFFTALNNGFISALISFLRTLVFQVLMIYLLPYFWELGRNLDVSYICRSIVTHCECCMFHHKQKEISILLRLWE